MENVQQWNSNSSPLFTKRILHSSRPNSYVAAVVNNSLLTAAQVPQQQQLATRCFVHVLPREVWLMILVNHCLSARDLASLEMSCKWFGQCWEGFSLIEEAARLIIKQHKRKRFKELTNRFCAMSWKERLHILNIMEAKSCTLASGSYQNVALTDNKHVITWGAGMFGQLGNGIRGDQRVSQNVSLPSDAAKVVQVSAGCGHTGILTEQGQVFVCGDNRYGQLGLANTGQGQHVLTPTRIIASMHVLQIACGSSHTMFLSDTGKVYSVGHGDSGQLGLGPHVKATSVPTCVPLQYEEFNFLFITAGIAHSVLLTECGRAFTCGLGSVGQLGHGGTKNLSIPAQVTAIVRYKKIVYASASVCHTVFVDSKGGVYSCGKGEGILGHGDTTIRTTPKRVEALFDVPIATVVAGVGRTVFITKDEKGFWCGEGIGNHRNVVTSVPTLMHGLPEPLVAAAIGNSHIVLKMKSGRFMSMGNNGRHQTGHVTPDQSQVLDYTYIPHL